MLPSRTGVNATPAANAVFTTVLTQGPLSRPELARITGLSPAAVTKAVKPILDAGYMEEVPQTERTAVGAGRPAHPLAIRPDREFFAGIKVTGTELIGVVTDLRAGVRTTAHQLIENPSDVNGVVADIAGLVRRLTADYADRTHCLGLSISGDVDSPTGTVRYTPFLGWRQVALGPLVQDATGLTVTVENDVKALTVAEHWFGEGVGADNFALVTVGAGIGCGLVINGRLVAGGYGVAGELGHIAVDVSGPDCRCGGRGCVETIASERAIVAKARTVTGDLRLDMAGAIDRAAQDPALRAVFAEAGHTIGLGLAALVNLTGPERVVVSGEGLAAYDLFEEQIRATFASQVFGAAAQCPLVVRPLPFEEWARGAAAVSIQRLFSP
ncbi:ROK family protein [Streptomyces sp. NPDC059909]|uniref:ROK family transcriptional regulator n=1 Tax=Streptomyces sp. NPDC059909 TaxID=3346998 RepID=UPI00365E675A